MENRIAKRQYIISTALRVQGQRDCKTRKFRGEIHGENMVQSRDQIVHVLL